MVEVSSGRRASQQSILTTLSVSHTQTHETRTIGSEKIVIADKDHPLSVCLARTVETGDKSLANFPEPIDLHYFCGVLLLLLRHSKILAALPAFQRTPTTT